MRYPPRGQGPEVGQRELGAASVDRSGIELTAEHRGDLEVGRLGYGEPFVAQSRDEREEADDAFVRTVRQRPRLEVVTQ